MGTCATKDDFRHELVEDSEESWKVKNYLQEVCQRMELYSIFLEHDRDLDGFLDRDDLARIFHQTLEQSESSQGGSFKQIPLNQGGSLKRLRSSDGKNIKKAEDAFVASFMKKAGRNNEGRMNFEEFVECCKMHD
jgi:Ca2+-binding EF-hand superfamily protein